MTIYGNSADNEIDGDRNGVEDDAIVGMDGDDVLRGLGGNDWLSGWYGNDALYGGDGNDELHGNFDSDQLFGEAGDDIVGLDEGMDGAVPDTLDGGLGFDIIRIDFSGLIDLSAFAITGIEGVRQNPYDWNLGGSGIGLTAAQLASFSSLLVERVDVTTGGSLSMAGVTTTNSQVWYLAAADTVLDFTGVIGSGHSVFGNSGDDTITGTLGADTIRGGSGSDTLAGAVGNDLLDGGEGVDEMRGGEGDDRYIVDAAGDLVIELANEGTDTVQSLLSFSLVGLQVENITLAGTADLSATGNGFVNLLLGNSGANLLDGGAGADSMKGGKGDDRYIVDHSSDIVVELDGQGVDTVESSASFTLTSAFVEHLWLTGSAAINGTGNGLANTIVGNANANIIDGKGGADTLQGGAGDDIYWVDDAGDKVIEAADQGRDAINSSVTFSLAGQFAEVLNLVGVAAINGQGNMLDNQITGNSAANALAGGAGNDRLDGGLGADTLKGGLGNDVLVVENAGDMVQEGLGEGTDTVEAWISYNLANNVEALKLMGSANLTGNGNGLANSLFGNSGNNVLNGGAGADTMAGGSGDDRYVVDNAGDTVVELAGQGMDFVQASVSFSLAGQAVEVLTLTGAAAINGTGNGLANILTGNGAANALSGGDGNDALHGGLGTDTLTGGVGLDDYWFETALGAGNVDTIAGFKAADDTIMLDRSIFTGIAADGVLAAGAFRMGAVAIDADDRILYDKVNGDLWYDADGVGGVASVLFAHIAGSAPMTSADFFAVA